VPDRHRLNRKGFNRWVWRRLGNYQKRYEVYYGGSGSGKSYGAVQKMALKAAANPRRVLVIRKVKATLGDSIYRLTRSILAELAPETGLRMKENKSEMCLSLSNGSQFLFKGLDDPEKLKSIADITDVIIEEATELSLNDFTQIDIRLRPPKEVALPQIYLMFNPVSKANWCYAHWILKPPKEAVIVQTTYRDNRFLSAAYRKTLKQLMESNPAYYRIYCLGEFASLDKLVFPIYEKRKILRKEVAAFPQFVGLDFGYVNDPSAIVWGRYDKSGKVIYILGAYEKKGMLNDQIAEKLRELGFAKEIIVADSAEQKSIAEIRRHGIGRIRGAVKGSGSIRRDIDRILSCRLVVEESLTDFLEELENYSWAKEKGEYVNRPIDSYNHCMDAMRYGLQAVMQEKGMRILK
jgi:phage terminase large subunit